VLTISIDGCFQNLELKIIPANSIPFLVETTGVCNTAKAKITLKDNIPSYKTEINFMLFVEAELDSGIFVNDAMAVSVKVTQHELKTHGFIAIPDGTFAGHVIMTLNQNYNPLGETLSTTDSYFSVDNQGKISTTRDLYLSKMQNDITLFYNITFDVKTSSTSKIIFSLTVVVVKLTFTADVTEGDNAVYRIARIELPGVEFNSSIDNQLSNVFKLTDSDRYLTVDETQIDFDQGQRKYDFILTTSLSGFSNDFSTRIIVNVNDNNDNPPSFLGDNTRFSISSTRYKSVIVGSVSARDVDTNSILTYSLESHQDDFSIDNKGIIWTNKTTENIAFTPIENERFYSGKLTLRIKVSDGKHSISKDFFVFLVQSPQLELNKKFENFILENATVGSKVANVSVRGYREFHFAASERASSYFSLNKTTVIHIHG